MWGGADLVSRRPITTRRKKSFLAFMPVTTALIIVIIRAIIMARYTPSLLGDQPPNALLPAL